MPLGCAISYLNCATIISSTSPTIPMMDILLGQLPRVRKVSGSAIIRRKISQIIFWPSMKDRWVYLWRFFMLVVRVCWRAASSSYLWMSCFGFDYAYYCYIYQSYYSYYSKFVYYYSCYTINQSRTWMPSRASMNMLYGVYGSCCYSIFFANLVLLLALVFAFFFSSTIPFSSSYSSYQSQSSSPISSSSCPLLAKLATYSFSKSISLRNSSKTVQKIWMGYLYCPRVMLMSNFEAIARFLQDLSTYAMFCKIQRHFCCYFGISVAGEGRVRVQFDFIRNSITKSMQFYCFRYFYHWATILFCRATTKNWYCSGIYSAMVPINMSTGLIRWTLVESSPINALSSPILNSPSTISLTVRIQLSLQLTQRLLIAKSAVCTNQVFPAVVSTLASSPRVSAVYNSSYSSLEMTWRLAMADMASPLIFKSVEWSCSIRSPVLTDVGASVGLVSGATNCFFISLRFGSINNQCYQYCVQCDSAQIIRYLQDHRMRMSYFLTHYLPANSQQSVNLKKGCLSSMRLASNPNITS